MARLKQVAQTMLNNTKIYIIFFEKKSHVFVKCGIDISFYRNSKLYMCKFQQGVSTFMCKGQPKAC